MREPVGTALAEKVPRAERGGGTVSRSGEGVTERDRTAGRGQRYQLHPSRKVKLRRKERRGDEETRGGGELQPAQPPKGTSRGAHRGDWIGPV